MSLPPAIWRLVYLAQLLLLSVAVGSWAVHQPRWMLVPRQSRFLIGFCVVPFLLGAWMLLLAALLPGAPRSLFLISPSLLAIALLFRYGPDTVRRLLRDGRRGWQATRNKILPCLIHVGAVLVAAVVFSRLIVNSRPPLVAFDALTYAAEALPFAQLRTTGATNDFRGSPDGTLRGDVHGFLFPAFLSHALITTGANPLGYPYDQALRLAFQTTVVYMLLSVMALAATVQYRGTGALAVVLLLQVPQLEYISYNASRDAFRIIPLMLLATVLVGLSPSRLRRRILRFQSLLPPLVLAAFALAGHTLGGIVVVLMMLAWLVWTGLQGVRWQNVLLVAGVMGVGLVASGLHFIQAYIETGHIWGNSPSEYAVVGTALEGTWIHEERFRTAAGLPIVQRLAEILERDQYRLSVPGCMAAILAIALWLKARANRRAQVMFFLALVVLTNALPLLNLLSIEGYRFAAWFTANSRYWLHWYPFAAVCVAMLTVHASERLTTIRPRGLAMTVSGILGLSILVVTFSAFRTVGSQWRMASWDDEWVSEHVAPLQAVRDHLLSGRAILLDDARYNYYLGSQAILIYSPPTWAVLRAQRESEVQERLDALNIGAVILDERYIAGWWDRLPLFSFLDNPENSLVLARGPHRIYVLAGNTHDRNRLVAKYLAGTRDQISRGSLCQEMAGLRPGDALAGYTYLRQEQWEQAIEAYESAIRSNPEDLSYYPCLAQAYQAQGRAEDALAAYRKAAALLEEPQVLVEYLGIELGMDPRYVLDYLASGEAFQMTMDSSTVYNLIDDLDTARTVSPDDSTYVRRTAFVIEELPRGVLFQHPPSQVGYQVEIPAGAALEFSCALAPDVWKPGRGDGVTFKVEIEDEAGTVYRLFSEYIDPKNVPAHRKWHDREIDLSRWSGQVVTLTLSTEPGPNGDDRYDWAGWGEPRIVQRGNAK